MIEIIFSDILTALCFFLIIAMFSISHRNCGICYKHKNNLILLKGHYDFKEPFAVDIY